LGGIVPSEANQKGWGDVRGGKKEYIIHFIWGKGVQGRRARQVKEKKRGRQREGGGEGAILFPKKALVRGKESPPRNEKKTRNERTSSASSERGISSRKKPQLGE